MKAAVLAVAIADVLIGAVQLYVPFQFDIGLTVFLLVFNMALAYFVLRFVR